MTRKPDGLLRIFYAFTYSKNGLLLAWRSHAAFRQEIYLLIPLVIVTLYFTQEVWDIAILTISFSVVLVTELLNSAIETVVDRISLEANLLSKAAKDLGSAAVFVALFQAFVVWVIVTFY